MNTENLIDDKIIYLKDAIDRTKPKAERYAMGFDGFNEAMKGGLKDGDLVVISGRSGEGKTSMAQSITYNFCKDGIPCLWFSYEVTLEELNEKFEEMNIEPFYEVLVPKQNTTGHLDWIKKKIIEGVSKYMTKVIFIDHIDFLVPSNIGRSMDNTASYLKSITTELKNLARNLKVIIFLMAHIKKTTGDKELEQEDIASSGGIYQLADYVFMIQRERTKQVREFGNPFVDNNYIHTNNATIKIVKNRQTGMTKIIRCEFINNKLIELN